MTGMQKKKFVFGALMGACLALAACGSVKQELGVARNSPDEFSVVKRAPLTLPPDYSLRPPGSPTETPSAAETTNAAKEAVLGKSEAAVEKGDSDKALLTKMGTGTANSDIRKQIDEDNGYIALKNRTVADKLIFWNDAPPSTDNIPESIVNAPAEAARIEKNKAEGKPVTEGTVPVIEKKTGTLGKIF